MGPMRLLQGTFGARRRQSVVEAAYDHFRLDRQGNLVSANALQHYDYLVAGSSAAAWIGTPTACRGPPCRRRLPNVPALFGNCSDFAISPVHFS